jgi:hypothetical protein
MLAAPTLQLQARRGDELMSLENPKPVIVVERILDSAGENKYIYYERGRFLGKVIRSSHHLICVFEMQKILQNI